MGSIFFIERGHADHEEKFETSMRAQFFPFKVKKKVRDELGNEMEIDVMTNIDGQLRPIKLMEYTCPDEFVLPLAKALGLPTDETYFDTGQKEEGTGNSFMSGFGIKAYLEAMRFMLKAERFPKQDPTAPVWAIPIYRDHVNILGIGYRMDGKIKTIQGEHDRV